jgi:hypothetical protein
MSDKATITISGFGCLIVLLLIAIVAGGFIGTIIAVAKWIAA